jgi:hypothetical protein
MRLGLVVVLVAACGGDDDPKGQGSCRRGSEVPSDAAMRTCASDARATLDQLAKMIRAEPVEVVGTDRIGGCWREVDGWRCPEDLDGQLAKVGLPRARYDRYLAALREVGAYRVERAANGDVTVSVYRVGNAVNSRMKDYVHSRHPPVDPVVADTDQVKGNHVHVRASIGDGWYIETSVD